MRFLPVFLELLHDPPVALFVSGRPLTQLPERVAVVGARNCSPLGNEVAMSIGAGLGGAGVCVVSGAARGIDAASHRGALDAGGSSLAVLGSGHDLPYPKGSAELIARIAANGAVVSEYAPGVVAEPFRFPARNRLVAALGRALVVVEGAAGSGSMISVDHALDLGRDVFAVPGPVTSPPEVPRSSVYPSGVAFAASPCPIVAPAPGRLSMTTETPNLSASQLPNARAVGSVEPPGG